MVIFVSADYLEIKSGEKNFIASIWFGTKLLVKVHVDGGLDHMKVAKGKKWEHWYVDRGLGVGAEIDYQGKRQNEEMSWVVYVVMERFGEREREMSRQIEKWADKLRERELLSTR